MVRIIESFLHPNVRASLYKIPPMPVSPAHQTDNVRLTQSGSQFAPNRAERNQASTGRGRPPFVSSLSGSCPAAERRVTMGDASSRQTRMWSASIIISITFGAALTLHGQGLPTVSTSISIDNQGNAVATTVGAGPSYHPSRVLVRFRNGAPGAFLPGSGPPAGFPTLPNLFLIENPPGLSVAEAVQRYRANPNVLYAEPDFIVQVINTPTDPLWSQQWDMTKISAPAAWDTQPDSTNEV